MQKELFQKFHQLPLNLKNLLFSREAVEYIEIVEDEYNIVLTEFLMKVVVGDIGLRDVGKILVRDFGQTYENAAEISGKLIKNIFLKEIDILNAGKTPVMTQTPNPYFGASSRPTLTKNSYQKYSQKEQESKTPFIVKKAPERVPSLYAPLGAMPKMLRENARQKTITKPWTGKEASSIVPTTQDITNLLRLEHHSSPGDAFIRAPIHTEEKTKFSKNITDMNTEEFIEELIRVQNLPVPNDDAKKRFTTIMFSYVKGIRDDYELKEKLMAPWKMGGMDFSSAMVENIQKMSAQKMVQQKETAKRSEAFDHESAIVEVQAPRKEVMPMAPKAPAPMPNLKHTPTNVPFTGREAPSERTVRRLPTNPLVQGWAPHQTQLKPISRPPLVKPKPVPAKLPVEQSAKEISYATKPQVLGGPSAPAPVRVPATKTLITPPAFTPPRLRPQLSSGKMAIMDIKAPVTPTGPIEELRAFTIKDLRQLSPRPEQVMEILKGKFDLLTEESYDRLAEGIKAWKQSPLHQLYIELGQESLEQGKPIEVIMENRKAAEQNYLTPEEFYAIADLNRKVRF